MKRDNNKAFQITIKKMMPVVLVTLIGTVLGLLSLYRSEVPMIRNFGIMLTIGIIIAFIVVIFIFMPLLYVKDKHFPKVRKNRKKKEIRESKLVNKILDFIFKFKYIVIALAVILAIFGIILDQKIDAETNIENFMPQDSQALQDIRELRSTIGSTEQIAIVISDDSILTTKNINALKAINVAIGVNYQDEIVESQSIITLFNNMGIIESEFMNQETIKQIPSDQRKLFINNNYSVTVINISIEEMDEDTFINFINNVENDINDLDFNLDITITGQSVIDAKMMKALTTGRYEITLIGISLIFITLLIIYKSFYRAILPIIPILLIIGWSGAIMTMFNLDYTPLTATLGALIMGIGTDYTILITERFKEELSKDGVSRLDAIKTSINKMGRPIFISALTTMGGFSALIFSDFRILSNFGIMTVTSFLLALLSAVIVLPAILAITFSKK